MNRILLPPLAIFVSPLPAATLVQELDTFESGPAPLVVSSGTQQQSFNDPGEIIGNWRVHAVSITANPFFQAATVGVSSANQQYLAELGPGVTADLSLTYDSNSVGLGGFDLTVGGATSLGFIVTDSDPNLNCNVTVIDIDGQVATFQTQQASAITSDTLVTFPFASFSNSSTTNFSQIDSLQFEFQNGVAGDFTLQMLGTYQTVPEPTTALLSLLSITGFGLRRTRRATA